MADMNDNSKEIRSSYCKISLPNTKEEAIQILEKKTEL
jgi:hypothetical protein